MGQAVGVLRHPQDDRAPGERAHQERHRARRGATTATVAVVTATLTADWDRSTHVDRFIRFLEGHNVTRLPVRDVATSRLFLVWPVLLVLSFDDRAKCDTGCLQYATASTDAASPDEHVAANAKDNLGALFYQAF